jgi:hypothetical protein
MKKYYSLLITCNRGKIHTTNLMLSEIDLLPQILKENKSVEIKISKCTKEEYELIFK